MDFIKSRLKSIKHATRRGGGMLFEPRKMHGSTLQHTFLVIGLAIWLHLSSQDWAILLISIAIVWAAEFLNTALEIVVDLASPELHPMAKAGKRCWRSFSVNRLYNSRDHWCVDYGSAIVDKNPDNSWRHCAIKNVNLITTN